MFELPRYVIKSGHILAEQGEIRHVSDAAAHAGRTLHASPLFDEGVIPRVRAWFDEHYSVQFENYGVQEELPAAIPIKCGQSANRNPKAD